MTEEEPARPEGYLDRAKRVQGQSFTDVGLGDTVTRLLAESVPMTMKVTAIDEKHIYCGPYKFDRETGFEVDEELQLGPQWGIIGSRLLRDDKE